MTGQRSKTFQSRRAFIKGSAMTVASFSLLKVLGQQHDGSAYAQAGQPIDEKLPMAVALGYVHDASKTDTAKFPKRKGPEGEKQFCHNCVLYSQGGVKIDGQPGEWGKCTLFPQGLVAADGWCNSWALKPA